MQIRNHNGSQIAEEKNHESIMFIKKVIKLANEEYFNKVTQENAKQKKIRNKKAAELFSMPSCSRHKTRKENNKTQNT